MTTFGPYNLMRVLGMGASGEVFEARHDDTDRIVALKRLFPHAVRNDVAVMRFFREFRAASKIHHPHVLQVFDVGKADGVPYFTMELLQGETLRKFVARGGLGTPELPRLLRLSSQIADALTALHAQGVAHRDVKPDNVLMRSDEDAVLCDFGLARTDDDLALTRKGQLVGTFRYLAPEVIQGEAGDAPSDVYALGVTIFEIITRRPPFPGDDTAMLVSHVEAPPPDLRNEARDVPAPLAELVLRMMDKDPNARPSSTRTATILADLAGLQRSSRRRRASVSISAPFVGRAEEVKRVLEVSRRAAKGSPQVAVISGASGMGKSRLLGEVARRLTRSGMPVFFGHAAGGVNRAYEMWMGALHALASRRGKPVPDLDRPRTGSGAEHRARVWRDVRALLMDASNATPVAFVLDDADRADELSLALLSRVCAELRGARILVVAAVTDTRALLTPLSSAESTVISLQPLSAEHSAELLRAALDEDTGQRPTRPVVQIGVPGRVVDAARALVAEETVPDPASLEVTEELPDEHGDDAPVRGAAAAFSDVSPPLAVERALAVLGTRAPVAMVLRVIGVPAESTAAARVLDGIQALVAAGHVAEDASGTLDFRTRERRTEIYPSIPEPQRRQIHLRVAEALSSAREANQSTAEVLAYHLLRAGKTVQAVDELAQAAEGALAVWAPEKALGLIARSLEMLAGAAPRDTRSVVARAGAADAVRTGALLLIRLQVLQLRGAATAWLLAATEAAGAIDAGTHPGLSSDLQAHCAEAALASGNLADAQRHAARAMELAGRAHDVLREADRALLGFRVDLAASSKNVRADLAHAVWLARRSRDASRLVPALIEAAAMQLRAARPSAALRVANRAVRLSSKETAHGTGLAARRMLAAVYIDLGDRTRAYEALVSHISDAELGGFLREGADGFVELARLHRNNLDLGAARICVDKALQMARELDLGAVRLQAMCLRLECAVLAARQAGTLEVFLKDDVERLVDEVRDALMPGADPWSHVDIWLHQGLARVVRGDGKHAHKLALLLDAAAGNSPRRWFEVCAARVLICDAARIGGLAGFAEKMWASVVGRSDRRVPAELLRAIEA